MTERPAVGAFEAADGDYYGRGTVRLAGRWLWLEALATGGPRIVRLGITGSTTNLLAETPDLGWDTPSGRYELLGGHRLWFAPEDADVAVPDGDGLAVERAPGRVQLTGRPEPSTGLVRAFEIQLAATGPSFTIRHELRNQGAAPIELAPWSITQLPLGGRVLLPQPRAMAGHRVRPNRNLVLWPYTSWDDPRIAVRDGLIAVEAVAAADLKVGCFSEVGWVAYERDGVALIRQFEPAMGARHPDLGCNVETFCGRRYLELEVLGPMAVVESGDRVALEERWELRRIKPGYGAADVAAELASDLVDLADALRETA